MVIYTTNLTDKSFKDFTKSGLVLVDVFAVWCGPCKQISPIVDEISSDYFGKLSVGKLDADGNPETMGELGIRSIPTLLLYKDGEVVEKLTGMSSRQKISELIDKHL